MNQILYKCKYNNNNDYNDNNQNNINTINNIKNTNSIKKSNNSYYIIIVIISIIFIFLALLIFFINRIKHINESKISSSLKSNYDIISLYLDDNENINNNNIKDNKNNKYKSKRINNDDNSFIIGLIEIDKIKLSYPIINNVTDEYLKISPCRFAGPYPNQIGNLCIAGHNYVDNRLFSKLYNLDINDLIKIYDLNGNVIDYKIYYKDEIEFNDLSCINQDTNGLRIVTLITCNNVNGKRLCIKALEIY